MFFDDIKTLYDISAIRRTHAIKVSRSIPTSVKATRCRWISSRMRRSPISPSSTSTNRQTAYDLKKWRRDAGEAELPIVEEKQSAHLKVTGTLADQGYKIVEWLIDPSIDR
jgi:hypothetical protein